MADGNGKYEYVTTKELADKLQSMRWEFRFLLALQTVGVLGLLYREEAPGVHEAVGLVLNIL